MAHWEERLCLTVDDPSLSCMEIAAAAALAVEEGANSTLVHAAIGLTPAELSEPSTRVSIRRQYAASQVIAAVCQPGFLLRLARRMRLTSYGIAGFALLSSPTLADALRTAERYSPLLNLKFCLAVRMHRGMACLALTQRYAMDDRMLEQCLRFELARLKTLVDDVLCQPLLVREVACRAAYQPPLKDLHVVTCVPTHVENDLPEGVLAEMRFDVPPLTVKLPQSHPGTHKSSAMVCDALMDDFASRYDLARQVKDILRRSTGRPPALPEIASTLCLSQRTLRRRLEALNSSYNKILDDVRRELAINYVTTTRYTTDVIAELLGYSEAANFRHAFKRWTGTSPRNYGDTAGARDVEAAPAGKPAGAPSRNRLPRPSPRDNALDVAVAAWR